jgi:hypothetical protein
MDHELVQGKLMIKSKDAMSKECTMPVTLGLRLLVYFIFYAFFEQFFYNKEDNSNQSNTNFGKSLSKVL